jgi:tetratricopeptide (TPR) repeat protein
MIDTALFFTVVFYLVVAIAVGGMVVTIAYSFLLFLLRRRKDEVRRASAVFSQFFRVAAVVLAVLSLNLAWVAVFDLYNARHPSPGDELFRQVSMLLNKGKYDDVIVRIERFLQQQEVGNPFASHRSWMQEAQLHLLLARSYVARGGEVDHALAIASCKRAISLYNNNAYIADAGFALQAGRLLLELGLEEDSVRLLREATVLSPSSPEVWFEFGNACYRNNRVQEAQEAWRRCESEGLEPWASYARQRLREILQNPGKR